VVGRTRISFAVSAVADLEAIRAWYADQQVPEVGERLLREVVVHVERLADFPESGRVVPEFGLAQLREIIHPPFRIVYRVDAERVRVVRVWRSERRLELSE
jgi:plasmid stabilization system protein ParE